MVGGASALLRAGSRVARLYSLAVDPSQRGRGLGAKLIVALVKRVPRRCEVISLEVRHDNTAALGLYERLGFTHAEHLPGYYDDGGHGVRLRAARKRVVGAGP